MRINAFIAQATGVSRRRADILIKEGSVSINSRIADLGSRVGPNDKVMLNNKPVYSSLEQLTTVMFNKPIGYVVSRNGQGANTIYDLLPNKLSKLKPVGRLDKDSSGLLLLTNDGQLAYELTHPSLSKLKRYEVSLDKPINPYDIRLIKKGISLADGLSRLNISSISFDQRSMTISMSEGRNRQIRRTFSALGYHVNKIHRIQFGSFLLGDLPSGKWKEIEKDSKVGARK